MRKGLIIALAAVLVLGLSGVAMAWSVDDTSYITDTTGGYASSVDWAAGGAEGCVPQPPACLDCPWDLKYDFTAQAGIIQVSGVGNSQILGNGVPGSGSMDTKVWGPVGQNWEVAASRVFINDTVEAYVCQPCCEVDLYRAKTSVNVEDGQAYIYDQQVSGMASNSGVADPDPVTEQLLQTWGTAGNDIDGDGLSLTVRMDAEVWKKDCMDPSCQFVFQEDHTMGIIGESVDFNVYAYQGMAHPCSNLYGALGCTSQVWIPTHIDPVTDECVPGHFIDVFCPIESYGKFETCPECP